MITFSNPLLAAAPPQLRPGPVQAGDVGIAGRRPATPRRELAAAHPTAPLFNAGVAGLAATNPLATFQAGLELEARERADAAARARGQEEVRELQVLGAELARIAEASGSERLSRLVAAGPERYGEAIRLVALMGAAQADAPTQG